METTEEKSGMTGWVKPAIIVGLLVVVCVGGYAYLQMKLERSREYARRAMCLNCIRNIGIAMTRCAEAHGGGYPPALKDDGEAPQRRFARLLKLGYLNTPKYFKCPSAPWDEVPDASRLDGDDLATSSETSIADACLQDGWCSYGVDIRARATDSPSRALLADRPHRDYWGAGVSSPEAGQPGSNSENHWGEGQNILYIDCHVKWSPNCKDDSNIDDNVYGQNREIEAGDDSNIDFGEKSLRKLRTGR